MSDKSYVDQAKDAASAAGKLLSRSIKYHPPLRSFDRLQDVMSELPVTYR